MQPNSTKNSPLETRRWFQTIERSSCTPNTTRGRQAAAIKERERQKIEEFLKQKYGKTNN